MNANRKSRGNSPFARIKRLIKILTSPPQKTHIEDIPTQSTAPQTSPEPEPENPMPLVHVPDSSADIIDMDEELQHMQEHQLAWPFSLSTVQQPPEEIPAAEENYYWEKIRNASRWVLLVFCFLLAALPSFLVFLDRWLENRKIVDFSRDTWCQSEFLCQLYWPSYFIVIIPASIILVILVVFVINDNRPKFESKEKPAKENTSKKNIHPAQKHVARVFEIIAISWAVIMFVFASIKHEIPGIMLLPAIFIYLFARILIEYSSGTLLVMLRSWWHRFWPLGLTHLALIIFLADIANHRPTALITFILLAAALVNLWKHRNKVEPIHWITLAAVVLFMININSWFFSTIGDEYGFFSFGKDILLYQNWDYRISNFFSGTGVYGSHPYFSSVIQSFSMGLLGVDNFGWRFSSPYLAALSIPMFYFFFRHFLDERVSLLGAGMIGCSHYLMTFGKIGYNNLQALFIMGLVLWAASEAVRKRRLLNYTLLGFAFALVFYVYPAALYVLPLAGVLLLMYDPPFNRFALKRWGVAFIAFALLFFPLFIQPNFWQEKVAGTLFYNMDNIMEEGGIAMHLLKNFFYSLYSFLFIIDETHFVTSSYIDPISGVLVLLGLAWVFKLLRRDRFAVFILIGFLLLNFFVGASHDRTTPPNTRMFLLVPWFTLLASLGLSWLTWQLQRLHASYQHSTRLAIILLSLVLVGNLYQAYGLSFHRNEGRPSLEVLFLRMLQRDYDLTEGPMRDVPKRSYLFITDEGWDIGGLRVLQEVYGVPDSDTQLHRVPVDSGDIPTDLLEQIQDENVGVIVYPHMQEDWRISLESQLEEMEKHPCVIRNTPDTDPRFTIWWSERWSNTCPANGNWKFPQ
jgi:4-amino-4-deoxy-L-arabinose transferase-like glycosyltransferase